MVAARDAAGLSRAREERALIAAWHLQAERRGMGFTTDADGRTHAASRLSRLREANRRLREGVRAQGELQYTFKAVEWVSGRHTS